MTETQLLTLKDLEDFLTPGYLPPYLQIAGREVGGHEIDHPRRMCKIAEKVAGPEVNLFLLKTAIWFHNLDRSVYPYLSCHPKNYLAGPYIPTVIRRFTEPKSPEIFSSGDIDLVVDAVERHSRLNEPDDTTLTIYLKDCDRLDGMGAIGLFNIIHYSVDRNFPLWAPDDFSGLPQSTAEDQLKSVVNDIWRTLEWQYMLRVPKAKELATPGCMFLRSFLTKLELELRALEILPPNPA